MVVVANLDAADSLAIAQHYARVRGVPAGNIIALRMPVTETVTWREFVSGIWQPLEDELVRREWIDGVAMNLFDEVGRRKFAIFGHRIEALVLCRGVPLKVANDRTLFREMKPFTDHEEFRTNEGSVDSELSLLAQMDYPINACVPNPLFREPFPTADALSHVIKVTRLDGPTAADAMGLVDLAVQAEHTGLLGRAYVDIAGPHEAGNRWMASVADEVKALGFDMSVGRGPQTFAATARIDAPVLYFGWYAPDLNGPFALPGFRFPPGAVAEHIHSFSAQTLRSASQGWCGPLVARGVTATVGNVYEPFLEYLHRPELLLEALAHGRDLADAAYFSLPVLSWQAVVIGDPLYRPFAVSLEEQTRDIAALPRRTAAYAIIRRMNLLDLQGKHADAIDAGRSGMKAVPNLALALALGERLQAIGDRDAAVLFVSGAAESAGESAGDWEVLREAAAFLAANASPAEAVSLYRRLFEIEAIPPAVESSWLVEARQVALSAHDAAQAAEWEEQIRRTVETSVSPASP